MEKLYNLSDFEKLFRSYLVAGNVSYPTLRNYLSDFRHFYGWILRSGKVSSFQLQQIGGIITIDAVLAYKQYLLDLSLPHKTVNRRLSTLRKFCTYCVEQGWMKQNPAKAVSNIGNLGTSHDTSIDQILNSFKVEIMRSGMGLHKAQSHVDNVREFFAMM